LSSLDFTSVTRTDEMFNDCSSLRDLNLIAFDTSNVTYMVDMFNSCDSLKNVNFADFDVSKVGKNYNADSHTSHNGKIIGTFAPSDMTINGRPWEEYFTGGSTVSAPSDYSNNVLMGDAVNVEIWTDIVGAKDSNTVFRTGYDRNSIATVNFLDSTSGAPASAWDVSEAKNGSVLAWVVPNGELYDLYIAGNGGVVAPANCRRMFCNYSNVTKINFNGCFDTSNVREIGAMFAFCSNLESLDLSSFDFASVETVGSMFYQCKNLTFVDMSGVDTSGLTNMYQMFGGCEKLEHVIFGDFDTSNVTKYDSFAPEGTKINGRPWKEYFK